MKLRNLMLVLALLLLAPCGAAQAQRLDDYFFGYTTTLTYTAPAIFGDLESVVSPASTPTPKPTPPRKVKTLGEDRILTIKLDDGKEVQIAVQTVGNSVSPTVVPAASPSPSPSSGRSVPSSQLEMYDDFFINDTSQQGPPTTVLDPSKAKPGVSPTPSPSPAPTPTYMRPPPARKLQPFLYVPFRSSDRTRISITEGYIYSKAEAAVYGGKPDMPHFAIDIQADAGTPLYAPCDGYAVQAYQTLLLRDSQTHEPLLYQGKTVGYGLGHIVEFQCKAKDDQGQELEVRVVFGHLREVSDTIPKVEFFIQEGSEYNPEGLYVQFMDKTKARKVSVGDYVGRVGRSGMGWGVTESPDDKDTFSWDEYHVHVEVYLRTAQGKKDPAFRWDPLGWYSTVDNPAHYQNFWQGDLGLFLRDNKRGLKFAVEHL